MTGVNGRIRPGIVVLIAWMLLAHVAAAESGPVRIAILPFYTEDGDDLANAGYEALQYRRLSRFIANRLVREEFEVINPYAVRDGQLGGSLPRGSSRRDWESTAQSLTRAYDADIAYIVWLDASSHVTSDGYCKARVRVEGEGYDSEGRDIGAGLFKAFGVTRRDCDDAVIEAAIVAGDEIGHVLGTWKTGLESRDTGSAEALPSSSVPDEGGSDRQETDASKGLIEVRLVDATSHLVEMFGDMLVTGWGATSASVKPADVESETPFENTGGWRWQVKLGDTAPSYWQNDMMEMLDDIYRSDGSVVLNGSLRQYSDAEVDLLAEIRPGPVTAGEIVFRAGRGRM